MSSRIPSLDGVRALAIAIVISSHYAAGPAYYSLTQALGHFGVTMFFVLSGYLITTLLQAEEQKTGRISLSAFYRRRCFRIFPACFAFIAIIAVAVPASRSCLLYAVTYTASFRTLEMPMVLRHLWSLSVEEQFYLLWPLVLVVSFRRRAAVAWCAVIAAGLFRLFFHAPSRLGYEHYSFPANMDAIAAGCLAAIYSPRLKTTVKWLAESPAILICLPVVAWTILCVSFDGSLGCLAGLASLAIALWLLLLVESRPRLFNNRPVVAVGVLSYSLYLWQQPFVFSGLPWWASLTGISLFATASYWLIEKPMIALGRGGSRRPTSLLHAS